jgi:hypothetical protein
MAACAALWTDESIGPTPADQRHMALLLAAKQFVETGLAEAFLELHHIARHAPTLPKTICSLFVLYPKAWLTQPRNQVGR